MLAIPHDIGRYYSYDHLTGDVTRIDTGKPSRAKISTGYLTVFFRRRTYSVHRIAWFLHYGADAQGYIDHINGDRADNRIANLRVCEQQQNTWNMRGRGHWPKGVWWQKKRGKFCAAIRVGAGQPRKWLGAFNTPEEAHAAYVIAAHKYHGEFARTE